MLSSQAEEPDQVYSEKNDSFQDLHSNVKKHQLWQKQKLSNNRQTHGRILGVKRFNFLTSLGL